MIDLKNAYELRSVLNDKIIDKIEEVQTGNIWYEAWKKLPISGLFPLILNKCKGADLVDYKLYGESVQESKNLLKPTNNVLGSLSVADGSINSAVKYATTTDFISLKAGTYTISYKTGANLRYVAWFNKNKEIVGNVWSGRANPYTFTIDSDYLVRFDIERDGNVAIENLETFFTEYEVQLEEGLTATEYVSYLPTPETPIEIESVGEKTINLANNFNVEETSSTPGSLTGAIITSEYIEMVRQHTYDYAYIPVKLKAGVNYTLWGEITAFDREEGSTELTTVLFGVSGFGGIPNLYFSSNAKQTIVRNYTPTEDMETRISVDANYGSPLPAKVRFKIMLVEGTYTKETIPTFKPYGYKIPVKASNDLSYLTFKEGYYIDANNNEVEYQNAYKYTNEYIPVLPNTEYEITFSEGNTSTAFVTIPCYDKNKGFIQRLSGFGAFSVLPKTAIFTTPEDCYFIRMSMPLPKYKIEFSTTTNIYLDEPLRKIGNYADYIDFENGKVVRKIYNEFITKVNSKSGLAGTYSMFLTPITKKPKYIGYIGYAISNKFKRHTGNYSVLASIPNAIQSYITTSGSNRVAYTFDTTITTVEQAQEEIGEGFDVYYVLAEEELQPIELPNIPTHKGTTILSVDTKIQPSNAEVKYIGKP